MEFIRTWATSLVFAALVAALIHMLAPSGSMEKILKTAIVAFFLCAFVSPLLSNRNILYLDLIPTTQRTEIQTKALEESIDRQIEQQVKSRISALISEVLKENGADPEKIIVNMDRLDDGSISIKQTSVLLKKDETVSIQKVKNDISQKLGIPVDVSWGSEREVES